MPAVDRHIYLEERLDLLLLQPVHLHDGLLLGQGDPGGRVGDGGGVGHHQGHGAILQIRGARGTCLNSNRI